MSVGKICQRTVITAEADESVLAAAIRMRRQGIGVLVVLDEKRRLVGMLTDRDVVARCVALGKVPRDAKIGDVMTQPVKAVGEDTPIELALAFMRSGGFRRVPVVDRKGRLAGLLALDDVLALLAEEFGQIGKLLAKSVPKGSGKNAVAAVRAAPSLLAAGSRVSER